MDQSEQPIPMPEALFPFNLSALGPKDEKLKELIDHRSTYWRKPAYLNERGWIGALLGFLEREKQGNIDNQFLEELKKFFRWHASLTSHNFPLKERLEGREPLFISESNRDLLREQLEKLGEKDFLKNPENLRWLKGVLGRYYNEINGAKIFLPNLKAIEQEIEKIINSNR